MNKGFTLMEILAVLLVIAVIASFAVPVVRSVRAEVRHQGARNSALKLAEAVRSYYHDSRGYLISGCISAETAAGCVSPATVSVALSDCSAARSSGLPTDDGGGSAEISDLFSCGYLSPKDFVGLPYKFTADVVATSLVTVEGTNAAGKYKDQTFYVSREMTITGDDD